MPIRPDLRPFYTRAIWGPVRRRILERARGKFDGKGKYLGGARCEQCGKPHRRRVFTITTKLWNTPAIIYVAKPVPAFFYSLGNEGVMFWREAGRGWRANLPGIKPAPWFARLKRSIKCVLTVAHLNHTPGDDRDENLKALCQWCHLHYDAEHHKESRCRRKDAGRPLITL